MKFRNRLFIVGALLLIWSCVPKPVVVTEPEPEPEPAPVSIAEKLFTEAEELYAQQSYEKALALYERYIDQYPDGQAAAVAMLRMGAIHTELANFEDALRYYNQLLADYPDSAYGMDANIGMLNAYYYEGRFSEVIQLASVLLADMVSKEHLAKTYSILGDTYIGMESPQDAVYFYTMAHKEATAPSDEVIVEKLKTAVGLLETDDILALLEHFEEDLPKGYLLYQLGLNYDEEHRYDEALKALSDFVESYPEHENVLRAVSLIGELSEKTFYYRTTIGCLLPLSGRYKKFGKLALKGIEFALAQHNSQPENEPIQLVIKDTASDSNRVIMAVGELVQERVAAIIGPMVSADYAAAIAQENQIPIITITLKEKVTQIGDNVFRNFLTPEMQVKRIVSYVADTLGVKNFAILYPEEKYGSTFMNLFWDEVINHGSRVVGVESYDPKHTDFATPIKKLVGLYYEVPEDLKDVVRPPVEESEIPAEQDNDLKPGSGVAHAAESAEAVDEDAQEDKEEEPEAIVDFEAIFIPDAPSKAGLIVPQLAFYDVEEVYLLGTNVWHNSELVKMAKDYVQGAIMPDGFYAGSRSIRVIKFVNQFESAYGEKPGVFEATTYDTASMLFEIVNRPDVLSRHAIKNELLNIRDYPGVTGLTSFDDNGEAHKQMSLLQIYGSRFVELE
jgi:ABC-type branched-subunit amino acid transport system substrate-binding protein/predicted negative regulator of RcsB-dependent stress response